LLDQVRVWCPYVSPFDPCPSIRAKTYVVPPNLFLSFQPERLPQFSLTEALRRGTLWPALYSPYPAGDKG
jgi:spore coat protein JA